MTSLLTAILLGAAPLSAAAPVDSVTLDCVVADWNAGAFGRSAAGAAVWVVAPDGTVRVDLAAADGAEPPASAQQLLERSGRGWTLVAGPDGGLYGAWDREWRPAPDGWSDLAQAVAAAAGQGASARARRLVVAAADGPEPDSGVAAESGFRASLVRRGWGGGGPGERVTVRPARDGAVNVSSSRRPGALVVRPRSRQEARGAAAEVFLPWWPLGDLLRFPDTSAAGTSREPGR